MPPRRPPYNALSGPTAALSFSGLACWCHRHPLFFGSFLVSVVCFSVYTYIQMRLHSLAAGTSLLGAAAVSGAKNGLPVDKVYGVNVSDDSCNVLLNY